MDKLFTIGHSVHTIEKLVELLKEHQDLLEKYKEETDLEDSEVLINYMDLLNKRVVGVSGQI